MNVSLRKKVFGLAAIAGCSSYGIWHYRRSKNRTEFLVLDPSEAVQNLNEHRLVGVSIRSLEALYHLNSHRCEEVTKTLNKAAWTQLCIHGSILCRFLLLDREEPVDDELELNKLLQKIKLDDKKWKKAIRWFTLNVCPDEDLRCQDSAFDKPSKMKRLNNLLQVLLYKSEMEKCDKLLDENVPLLLLRLVNTYRDEKNKHLVITAMKIMANIASYSKECALNIANSNWMPMLAEMVVQPVLQEETVLSHKVLANMLYSFGASNYFLSNAVYEFYRPDKEPILDVIFIHGFRGSLFRTWRQRDNPLERTVRFWPREWLPNEFKDDPVRIIGLDYASKLLQFGELMDTIEERSKKLKRALENAGVGSRPLVFCVHSMGGLIVKEMLSRNDDLLDKTVGIMFMGTPHRGTPVISSYLKYIRPTHDMKLLQIESQLNKDLHERFIAKLDKIPDKIPLIVSLIEMEKAPLFGANKLIVPPESSYFEGAVYHVHSHHYNICKPESIFATSYCVIVNFLKDTLRIVKQNS